MTKVLLAACVVLACVGAAQACEVKDQKVIEIMSDDVGTYDKQGNLLADVKKTEIPLQQNILACQDSPSLVQVKLTPGKDNKERTAWVNLLEVKVAGKDAVARKCKDAPPSHLADTIVPATSGLDPCTH
jgi:hypothetical protein